MTQIRLGAAVLTLILSMIPVSGRGDDIAGGDLPVDGSTRAMAELLKECAARINVKNLGFMVNDRRAALLESELGQLPPTADRLELQNLFAVELLRAGRFQESLQVVGALEEDSLRRVSVDGQRPGRVASLKVRAMANLRMAEELNCCRNNNKDSCLMPIRGGGIHTRRENGQRAIAALLELLEINPDDLEARWMLNIAHMTLGTYPSGVPKRYLVPPSAFASEYPLPRFDNVAKEAGVGVHGLAGGAILEDFDNDGLLDLFISHIGLDEQASYFHNRGDGTFEDRTGSARIRGEVGGLNAVQADYDNDGFVDVLVLRGGWMRDEGRFPLSLLHNNGDGTFTDVTVAAGLLRFAPTQTAVWLDFDGDGWLDLYVGNESTAPEHPYPCHLFRNNGDGTFTDVARETGVAFVGFVKGVASADYDNDGRPDLYLSTQGGDNVLYHNDGPVIRDGVRKGWHFTDVARAAGVLEPKRSFGVAFFDYDNDGWPDLWVTGYDSANSMAGSVAADYLGLPTTADRGRMYHNEHDGTFRDVTKELGLYKVIPAMGLNFGDLDNDGYLDLYLATGNPELSTLIPNRMFRNDGGRRFQDVTAAGNFGHLQKGHAVAFGDVDNVGAQDVFSEMGGAFNTDTAYSAFYKNPGTTNGWIGIELAGVRSNRKGVGARIKVTVETARGPRSFYRDVNSGGSFGANPLRQQIGVGAARRVSAVEIFWPATGVTQRVSGLELRRWYEIREGAEQARPLVRPRSSRPRIVPGVKMMTVSLREPDARISADEPREAHRN